MTTVNGSMATTGPSATPSSSSATGPSAGRCQPSPAPPSSAWNTGQVLVLTPVDGALEVELSVPDGDDAARFAQVVKDHLERFGQREELNVVWHL